MTGLGSVSKDELLTYILDGIYSDYAFASKPRKPKYGNGSNFPVHSTTINCILVHCTVLIGCSKADQQQLVYEFRNISLKFLSGPMGVFFSDVLK